MKYSEIERDTAGGFRIGDIRQVPDISQPQESELSTLFLGPKAENQQLLNELINKALSHIYDYRQYYSQHDPEVITETIKSSRAYQNSSAQIQNAFDELLNFLLKNATPYFSLRYQGHMLWDNTLPAIAGYFATMLHNPNNVTPQASTSTTPLAIMVGWDLCQMVGFPMNNAIEPWSHITADGTISNIESLWSTRELRYLPFAVLDMLNAAKELRASSEKVNELMVTCCNGQTVRLSEASTWDLLNLTTDEVLAIPKNIANIYDVKDVFEVWSWILPYSQNACGGSDLTQRLNEASIQKPIIITPSTKHYSWPKAAAICGYGYDAINNIHVDADARMDLTLLERQLELCLNNKIPIAMLVVVCGSTEESAVDNISKVLALRKSYRQRGLNFSIHVDAAWGGYMLSVIRKDYRLHPFNEGNEVDSTLFIEDTHITPASDYVLEQLKHIRFCDSVTIDPHKWGYVQYPAGSILYRNGEQRRLTTFTSAYIGNSNSIKPDGPTVGIFGIEGSRAGASAAAVFFSHRCLRPSVSGYGKLISECLFNTVKFYVRLLTLNSENLNFIVVPLPRLPVEKNGGDIQEQLAFIQQRILPKNRKELFQDSDAWQLLRELGPDQNILDYSFNLRFPDGSINTDIDVYNKLNELIYDKFSMHFEYQTNKQEIPVILTKTTFFRHEYGDIFMDTFAQRLNLNGKPRSLNCLRSVVMDPYITHTTDSSYFVEIINKIKTVVSGIIDSTYQK